MLRRNELKTSATADEAPNSSTTNGPPGGIMGGLRRVGDRIFPVKPGPVPPWSRVVTLIFLMAIIWEAMWLLTFVTQTPDHDLIKAWAQASKLLPIAVVLATAGAIPGFWFMRRRMEQANIAAGLPANGKSSSVARGAPRQRPAVIHASPRGRRRQIAKKRTRR